MPRRARHFVRSAAFFVLAAAVQTAAAESLTWTGAFGSDWSDGRNWNPAGPPGSANPVIIGGSVNLSNAGFTNDLSLGGTLRIYGTDGAGLSVDGAADVAGEVELMSDSGNSAYISVNNALTLSGGQLVIDAATNPLAGASPYTVYAEGGLFNNGTVLINSTASFVSNYNTSFVNNGQWLLNSYSGQNVDATISGGSFVQNSGTLAIGNSAALTISGRTFYYNGGSIQNTVLDNPDGSVPTYAGTINIVNGGLSCGVSDGNYANFNVNGSFSLLTDLPAHTNVATVISAASGPTNFSVPSNFTNNGYMQFTLLDSISGNVVAGSGLSGDVFTNRGQVYATKPNGTGGLVFYGALVNYGIVVADANVDFQNNVANEGTFDLYRGSRITMENARFNQDAGSLGLYGDTSFTITAGGFNYNGGVVNLTLNLYDSFVSFLVPDSHGLAVNAYGNLTLNSNIPINTSVFAVANMQQPSQSFSMTGETTNYGTIVLSSDDNQVSDIIVNTGPHGSQTFYNSGTLKFEHNGGTGYSVVYGTLVNNGLVHADTNIYLRNTFNENQFSIRGGVTVTLTNYAFTQDAGYLGDGGAAQVNIIGGGFNYNGGIVYATVNLYSSYLTTATTNGQGTAFNIYPGGAIYGDLAPNTVVAVVANSDAGANNLNVENNATNHGTILFNGLGGNGANLVIGNSSGTYHNAGTLNFNPDSITQSSVYGRLDNLYGGTIHINGHTVLNGGVTNYGSMTIANGATAELANNQILYQYGTLEIDGTLSLDDGAQVVPFGAYTLNVGGSYNYPGVLETDAGALVQVQGAAQRYPCADSRSAEKSSLLERGTSFRPARETSSPPAQATLSPPAQAISCPAVLATSSPTTEVNSFRRMAAASFPAARATSSPARAAPSSPPTAAILSPAAQATSATPRFSRPFTPQSFPPPPTQSSPKPAGPFPSVPATSSRTMSSKSTPAHFSRATAT